MTRAFATPLLVILLLLCGATTATAATFNSEAPHTTITGSQITTLALTTDPGVMTCANASFSATVEGTSFGGFTATPVHESCVLKTEFGNIAVSVSLNGCDYRFTAAGGFEIQCPVGKSIVISGPGCTVTLPAQSTSGLEYVNTGSGSSRDLDIAFNLSGLAYSYSGFTCGSGSGTTNGTWKGAMTAVGECGEVQTGIWAQGEGEPKGCGAFNSELAHTTITGSQTTTLNLTTDPGKVNCKKATFSATAEGTPFETFTATPIQSECTLVSIFGNIAVTTTFNGCDYVFAASGAFEIKCPVGKNIVISGPGCTVTLPAQSAGGLEYVNTGSGSSRDLDIAFNLTGLAYSYSGFTCGSGSNTKNGTWTGEMTAVGDCPGGGPVGIWLGEEEEGTGECPDFHSEAPHTTITGSQSKTLTLTTDPGTVTCKQATFTATAESSAFESLTAAPSQSECTLKSIFGNIAVTAGFNGCDFAFAASGAFEIKCPVGKNMVFSGSGCTVTLPAQSAGGLEYVNTGSGSSRDLDIAFNLSGLTYSYSGFTCGSGSNTRNGTWTGAMTAVGENTMGEPTGIWS